LRGMLSLPEGPHKQHRASVMPMKIYAPHWNPEWEAGTPQK